MAFAKLTQFKNNTFGNFLLIYLIRQLNGVKQKHFTIQPQLSHNDLGLMTVIYRQ